MIAFRAALWMLCILGVVFTAFAVIGLIANFLNLTMFGLVFGVGLAILWVGAIYDIWRRADLGMASRILWTLAIIFLPVIGTFIYVLARPADSQVTYRGEQVA